MALRGGHRHFWRAAALTLGVVVCLAVALAWLRPAGISAGEATPTGPITGTKRADTLVGTARGERIRGLGGNDWLRGLGGNDVLDGGPGKDRLAGGPGNDTVLARDGEVDRVYCGFGRDRVTADAADIVLGDCEAVSRPPTGSVPPESRTDCGMTNYRSWAWQDCKPGTTIVLTNESWNCVKPLDTYGNLPIKVVINATRAWSDTAAITLNSGCVGVPGTDVNLIVDIRGDGPRGTRGAARDAFKTRVNPQDIRVTGSLQCGPLEPGAHQDALQIQGGTNITFVNVESGDFTRGLSTCAGAGGGPFYSLNRITNVDILGGRWIGCNHALNGAHPGTENDVTDAKFRSGRNDGSDPNCNFFSSRPCVRTNTLRLTRVTCEEWLNGRWVAVPPR